MALNALQSHIKVSIHLKKDLPDEAWNHLISAQDYAASAIVAHPINAHLEHRYCVYLGALERLIFPPQVFMSTGLTVDEEECSICNGIYGECGHVAGKAYMGKFCCIVVKKIRQFNEVSIVDDPADKRCRVTHYHIGGKKINRMTLEEESE